MARMPTHFPPTCCAAQQQGVLVCRQDSSDKFAVAERFSSFLDGAHKLMSHSVLAKTPAYVNEDLANIIERDAGIIWTERGPSRDPIPHVRHQNRMFWI